MSKIGAFNSLLFYLPQYISLVYHSFCHVFLEYEVIQEFVDLIFTVKSGS